MFVYEIWQWFLFLYIYCFLGWVWETIYVSAKKGCFENRGFMNGPFLPIYGSGAIVILVATIPVKNQPLLVFLCGMLAATALELFTGIAMEKIFHMRYWDYSYRKIQYKGHICLVSSIAWGAFSCLMIYGIHKPVENMVLSLNTTVGQAITMFLTVINVADFTVSVKAALELKNMLITAEDIKAQIDRLERRAEIVEVFMADSAGKATEEVKDYVSDIIEKITSTKEEAAFELSRILSERDERMLALKLKVSENKAVSRLLKRNPQVVSKQHQDVLMSYRDRFLDSIERLKNR